MSNWVEVNSMHVTQLRMYAREGWNFNGSDSNARFPAHMAGFSLGNNACVRQFCIWFFCQGNKFNFNKYNRGTIDSLGTKYDYGSVMHYGARAFTKNGRPTIVSKQSGVSWRFSTSHTSPFHVTLMCVDCWPHLQLYVRRLKANPTFHFPLDNQRGGSINRFSKAKTTVVVLSFVKSRSVISWSWPYNVIYIGTIPRSRECDGRSFTEQKPPFRTTVFPPNRDIPVIIVYSSRIKMQIWTFGVYRSFLTVCWSCAIWCKNYRLGLGWLFLTFYWTSCGWVSHRVNQSFIPFLHSFAGYARSAPGYQRHWCTADESLVQGPV